MSTAAAKGKSSWRLIAAGLALLLAAGAAEASRFSPSSANDLLEKHGASTLAAAPHADDLTATFVSEPSTRFLLFTAADREALTAPLAGELEAALEDLWAEKLASGGQTWGLRSNLWRVYQLTTISQWDRFGYARARWYDARNASWLSEDPLQDVDSPNLYAYVAWQPQMATDPLGLQVLGEALSQRGEWFAAEKLRKKGWQVLFTTEWNAPGADLFAVNPATGELAFFDDKNWIRRSVSRSGAKALLGNFATGPSLERAAAAIEEADLDKETKRSFLRKLDRGEFSKYITSAAPESRIRTVSESLERKGVRFFDLSDVEIPDLGAESHLPAVPRSRELALRALSVKKALPGILAVTGIVLAQDPAEALGETLDPFSALTGGVSTTITDDEAARKHAENLFLAAFSEHLNGNLHSAPPGNSSSGVPPLLPSH